MASEIRPVASGWEQSAASSALAVAETGTITSVAREESELKAAIFLARSFPRDELLCYARLMRSCARPGFADGAEYKFKRGSVKIDNQWVDNFVTGPSVQLAREASRCWGNIRYGIRLVALDEETVHIKAYAHDLETNAYVETEDKFARLIQRKKKNGAPGETEWIKPDERDLRELINRRGAILERNAILKVLPPDAIQDAIAACSKTLRTASEGDLGANKEDTLRRLVVGFDGIGVTSAMLASFLGHPVAVINGEELAELRKVFRAIVDGQGRREDYFDVGGSARPEAGSNDLAERLRRRPAEAAAPVDADLDAVGLTDPQPPAARPDIQPVASAPQAPLHLSPADALVRFCMENKPSGGDAKTRDRTKIRMASKVLEEEEDQYLVHTWAENPELGKSQAEEAHALAQAAIDAAPIPGTSASADGAFDDTLPL
jgi:hypothetical protein